jgi:hypothetical protein
VGAERGRDLGGLANLIGTLDRRMRQDGLPITEAQRRLIMRKLVALEADDGFSLTKERQLEILSDVVAGYLRVRPEVVRSYARSC